MRRAAGSSTGVSKYNASPLHKRFKNLSFCVLHPHAPPTHIDARACMCVGGAWGCKRTQQISFARGHKRVVSHKRTAFRKHKKKKNEKKLSVSVHSLIPKKWAERRRTTYRSHTGAPQLPPVWPQHVMRNLPPAASPWVWADPLAARNPCPHRAFSNARERAPQRGEAAMAEGTSAAPHADPLRA